MQEYAPIREVRATAGVPWLGMHILNKSCSGARVFRTALHHAQVSCTGNRYWQQAQVFSAGLRPRFFCGQLFGMGLRKGRAA